MAEKSDELIVAKGIYGGHSARGNFDIELKATFTDAHVTEAIQFIAGIGQHLILLAFIGGEKVKLGIWSVYAVRVDRNLQTTVTFKTNKDLAKVDNLSKLLVEDEEITFKAKLTE